MNSTMEKMADENPSMMDTTVFIDPSTISDSKECAILGLIKNQRIVLEEEFTTAKEKYAGKLLNDKYNPDTYNAELDCRIIDAKLNVVTMMQKNVEKMLSSACVA